MEVFLYNSTVCRLCGEENDNGTLLYSCEENSQNLSDLINSYLPLKVTDDGQLPRTICPGCTIQLEATVEFMTLILNGQKIIRELYQREKEYKSNVFNNTSKEEDVITENIVYENDYIVTSDGLYQVDHPLSVAAVGLDKPKRKRGRPPKKHKTVETTVQVTASQDMQKPEQSEEPSGKRRRKTPTRFKEAVQGKELERIFIEEGVTDGNSDTESPDVKPDIKPVPKEPEVIGHLEDSGELVVVVKGKGRGRPKGRMRQTRQECAICGMEFSCVGRYMSHVASHGPVQYQCPQCDQTFSTRLLFNTHQREEQHTGQVVIPCSQKTEKEVVKKQPPPSPAATTEQPSDLDLASVDKLVSNACRGLPDLNPPALDDPSPDDSPSLIYAVRESKQEQGEGEGVKEDTTTIDRNEVVIIDEPEKTETEDDKTKKGKPKLKCNQCDKVFSNKQSKSLHIKAAHVGSRPYACGECGAAFAYPRSLSLHALSHRRQRPQPRGYACDLCGKVLNHPSSVVYHKEAEHAGQRYVCNKCGKSFKHKQLLKRHQLVHSQHRPFTCKTCNSSFKTKAILMNHQLLHTGVKKFTCEICKHKFAHKTSLTLHMRWHTGHKPYSCGKCGKSFSQKGNLSEHERIHTGEKPFECNLCSRRFTTSSQHRLHARRHVADRPIACATCDKRFATRAAWAAHVRREAAAAGAGAGSGGAHTCGACGKQFAERWALHKHLRRHTGERPFRCPHCPRAFADCSNLNKHKRQVHKQISLLAQNGAVVSTNGVSGDVTESAGAVASAVEVTSPADAEAARESDGEERIIYVAYDLDDKDDTAYHIVAPDQVCEGSDIEMELGQAKMEDALYSRGSLLVPVDIEPQKHMPVTDEQGNPLHFTMQDGTRLAITSADGQSLQVITQDGQTIPVEINGFADEEEVENPDTIVHQLNLQKSVDGAGAQPVTHFYTIV